MIDPTSPAVLDVHDFRAAGDTRAVRRTWALGRGIGNPVIEVTEEPISVQALLESVIDGVLVTGDIEYPVVGQCSRCLDPIDESRTVPFSELYLWSPPEQIDPDADPLPLVQAGLIELSDVVRDAIVLDLPLAPVCREDCPGLCAECGARLADDPGHAHAAVDPRWQALAGWESGEGEATTAGDGEAARRDDT